jgi:hypothetical protein
MRNLIDGGKMTRRTAFLLFFICTLGLLSYFSISTKMANLSDGAIAIFGVGLLALVVLLRKMIRG